MLPNCTLIVLCLGSHYTDSHRVYLQGTLQTDVSALRADWKLCSHVREVLSHSCRFMSWALHPANYSHSSEHKQRVLTLLVSDNIAIDIGIRKWIIIRKATYKNLLEWRCLICFTLLKSIKFKDGNCNFTKSSNEEVNTYHCDKVINHSWIKGPV